ncbi:MAG TPA: MBL fold metallo-hydrolase [Gammaproteobacteria bacterium]|nr:MBL fold metallo-hydrolase [Gammaproteobacteria bacterium]
MAIALTFLGAARDVTGSCHLLRVGDSKLLLDCGQIQGSFADELQNEVALPIGDVDAVVLSHAHIDHSGRLPLLRKQGFRGPIYTHRASRDLCEIMLRDAAYLHEREAEWRNARHERADLAKAVPLYTRADAQAVAGQFVALDFDVRERILPGVEIRLRSAGHILGAALVELWLEDAGRSVKLVYSGDLGYAGAPLLGPPTPVRDADLVVMESTYGDREHRPFDATLRELEAIVRGAADAGGNILIPAFAVGRTQDVLYVLAERYDAWRLDEWRIFLDSPMAIEATELYWRYRDLQRNVLFRDGRSPQLANVIASQTAEDSARIEEIHRGAIVIAGSGMCTGGRIVQHLRRNLSRPECHVVLVGFQAQGTLGRRLVDGATRVRLLNEMVEVGAQIHTIGGLSAHADRSGLLGWYAHFEPKPPVCLVHGEPPAQISLADALRARFGADVRMPARGESFVL